MKYDKLPRYIQKPCVWANRTDFANPEVYRWVRSPADSMYFTHVQSWSDLVYNCKGTSIREASVCYDPYMIAMEVKSANRSNLFGEVTVPLVNLLKWFDWNVSEQEGVFAARTGSFNTKKYGTCLFFFCVGLLMPQWFHPSPDARVQRHLSSRLSVARPVEAADADDAGEDSWPS